jgi:hypothetical protein
VIKDVLLVFTNFFSVTAYTGSGVESDPSNELLFSLPRGNTVPVPFDDFLRTRANNGVRIQLNGSDEDDDSLTYRVTEGPHSGTLWGTPPDLVYVPNPDFSGYDSFRFVVSDELSESAPATIEVSTAETLSIPMLSLTSTQAVHTIGEQFTLLDPAASLIPSLPFVLAGGTVTATIISNAGPGDLLLLEAGAANEPPYPVNFIRAQLGGSPGIPVLQYSLKPGATLSLVEGLIRRLAFTAGPEGFPAARVIRLVITDSEGLISTSADVTMLINRAPLALPDQLSASKNASLPIEFARLLANDMDWDGDPLSITAVRTNIWSQGTLVARGNQLIYTPPEDFEGRDSFDYELVDNRGGRTTSWVDVLVSELGKLKIEAVFPDHSGTDLLFLTLSGEPHRTYDLLMSEDFETWQPVAVGEARADGLVQFYGLELPPSTNRLFRAREQ